MTRNALITLPFLAMIAGGCTPMAVSGSEADPGATAADTAAPATDGSQYYFVTQHCDTGENVDPDVSSPTPCQGWDLDAVNLTSTSCDYGTESFGLCTIDDTDIAQNWNAPGTISFVRGTLRNGKLTTTEAYTVSGDRRGYPVYLVTPTESGYHRARLNTSYQSDFDFLVGADGAEVIADYAAGYVTYDAATDSRTFHATAIYAAADLP